MINKTSHSFFHYIERNLDIKKDNLKINKGMGYPSFEMNSYMYLSIWGFIISLKLTLTI